MQLSTLRSAEFNALTDAEQIAAIKLVGLAIESESGRDLPSIRVISSELRKSADDCRKILESLAEMGWISGDFARVEEKFFIKALKDAGAADRMRRSREKKKASAEGDVTNVTRNVTPSVTPPVTDDVTNNFVTSNYNYNSNSSFNSSSAEHENRPTAPSLIHSTVRAERIVGMWLARIGVTKKVSGKELAEDYVLPVENVISRLPAASDDEIVNLFMAARTDMITKTSKTPIRLSVLVAKVFAIVDRRDGKLAEAAQPEQDKYAYLLNR